MADVQAHAKTSVAAWRDFEVLHSCLLAVPHGCQTEVDHGLERGPAIVFG